MCRIKSAAGATLAIILAIAAFGVFASVGLAVLGAVVSVGGIAALAGVLAMAFGKSDEAAARQPYCAPAEEHWI